MHLSKYKVIQYPICPIIPVQLTDSAISIKEIRGDIPREPPVSSRYAVNLLDSEAVIDGLLELQKTVGHAMVEFGADTDL